MPYISRNDDRREKLRKGEPALIAGELNYQIFYYIKHIDKTADINSEWCREDIKQFVDNFLGEKPNYQRYNDMTGCLIRCMREIKRRTRISPVEIENILLNLMDSYDDEIARYEDKKCSENGDVE